MNQPLETKHVSVQQHDQTVAAAAKITSIITDISNAPNASSKLALLVDLITKTLFKDESAFGLFRRGNTVVSDVQELTKQQVSFLKKAQLGQKFVLVIPTKGLELVIACKTIQQDKKVVEAVQKRLEPFDISIKRYRLMTICLILCVVGLLFPVSETINTPGTVIGHTGVQISSENTGVLSEIIKPYGLVKKGELIGRIRNNSLLDLSKAKNDLLSVEQKISSEGISAQESLSALYIERKKLKLQVEQKEKEVNANTIFAPIDGLIYWKPNILGSRVDKAEIMGEIHPPEQNNIEIYVPRNDWIGLRIGDKASFLDERNYSSYEATVVSIPAQAEVNNGTVEYAVKLKLDNDFLSTGTTGNVSATGNKTIVIAWLFRKQIAHFLAWLSQRTS